MFALDRFVSAQAGSYDDARRELAAGRKRSHWMWFVFPQLRGLGQSETARFYGLDGIEEARAFLAHPVLGPRLLDCTALMLANLSSSLHEILGRPDDLKFVSCMTLFRSVQPDPFEAALARFAGGVADGRTLEMLDATR